MYVWVHVRKHLYVCACICVYVCVYMLAWHNYCALHEKPKFVVSPDITLCGWLGSKHQPTTTTVHYTWNWAFFCMCPTATFQLVFKALIKGQSDGIQPDLPLLSLSWPWHIGHGHNHRWRWAFPSRRLWSCHTLLLWSSHPHHHCWKTMHHHRIPSKQFKGIHPHIHCNQRKNCTMETRPNLPLEENLSSISP